MAKKAKATAAPKTVTITSTPIKLREALSTRTIYQPFDMWLVGDTPLITHAWSEKAKREMLQKHVKATRAGREERNPEEEFVNSLYDMGNGYYGFPVTGVKNAILASAHKDKGIARTDVRGALFLNAEMVRARPALAGAICDMPLIRIYGPKPAMREDMVKIGAGLNKTANLAYRGQFTVWAMHISGKFNPAVLTAEGLAFLIEDSGLASGLGEWRNERKGVFGAYHLATAAEEKLWEAFIKGRGALPVPASYQQAAE